MIPIVAIFLWAGAIYFLLPTVMIGKRADKVSTREYLERYHQSQNERNDV